MRRRQLLEVAGRLLTERGVEHVHITDVAEHAKVSRPLVYRLFPTRQVLVRAVLEDFGELLSELYREAVVRTMPGSLEAIVEGFVSASCDAIEARGAGPWRLLDGSGSEPELARLGRATTRGLLEPWDDRLSELTGRSPRRSAYVMWVIVAAGRAALDGWIEGQLSRNEAVADGTRVITALLIAFSQGQSVPTQLEQPPHEELVAKKPATRPAVPRKRA